MKITGTEIAGVWVLEPCVFRDERGYFFENFSRRIFEETIGKVDFVQENESCSSYGVVRGLHYQLPPYTQAKLVRVVEGRVWDVAVDLRKGSETFGRYLAVELSGENKKQFFIPKDFAHGFLVLSDEAEFAYKCTDFYHPDDEGGLIYNDPDIGVNWPIPDGMQLIMAQKDQNWGGIRAYTKQYRADVYEV